MFVIYRSGNAGIPFAKVCHCETRDYGRMVAKAGMKLRCPVVHHL